MLSYGLRWLRILFHCLVDVDESSRICFQTSAKCMQQHSRVPTTVGLSVKCLCWVPEICLSILFPGPSWGHEPNWAMAQCATTCGLEPRWRICPWTCQQPWATMSNLKSSLTRYTRCSRFILFLQRCSSTLTGIFFAEVLDNPWHQPRTFPAFQTEEEGRGGEKEKTPGHEVGKVDKNSNSILWQGGPKVYQGGPVWIRLLIHWFRLDLCRVGFLHRKTAFYLRRLYRLSGAAASQAQKEEEA